MSDAYLGRMFARVITLLAILAVAAATTGASTHAARMSLDPDHAIHGGAAMQAPHDSELSCAGDQHCGSADAGMCAFVCAGLSAFLTLPGGDAEPGHAPASHDLASGAIRASRAPGLNERPPKTHLL